MALGACGSAAHYTPSLPTPKAAAKALAPPPAFGITEDDAALLWSPQSPVALAAGAAPASGAQVLARARAQLTALHPRYVRLLVDWAALQPHAGEPPQLERAVSGCARTIAPCAPYAGLREELAAIASQQRHGGGFEAVIVIYGTPPWAARPASGCERAQPSTFSRAPTVAGLAAYRSLIRALVALGAREGVALDWWAPWNEPNDPTFLSPQRSSCAAGAASTAPLAYAQLARAMATQLRLEGGERHLLLGELNAYESGAFDRTSIAEFVAALPADVFCLGDVWTVHAYAARGRFARAPDPVSVLEHALALRERCSEQAPIWVTEAGAGASHPGDSRSGGAAEETDGCRALAQELAGWTDDRRVGAVFQYTFRDDPAFPVGLVDPSLAHVYASYRLWLAWQSARRAGRLAAIGACT